LELPAFDLLIRSRDPRPWVFLSADRNQAAQDSYPWSRSDSGWVWSKHAGAQTGMESQHPIRIIQPGKMGVKRAEGSKCDIAREDDFEVGAGHDPRVVGEALRIAFDVSFKRAD
jgi:hypothetical protein